MESINKNETFTYTYSAKQQDEVKRIVAKYLPQEENTMEQLRRLDKSATKRGTRLSLVIGIVGSLVMGVGMSCTLVWQNYFILGIIIGIIGMVGVALAYPIYNAVTKKQREKLAPEIKRLSEELCSAPKYS